MLRYIARRLLYSVLVLVIISILTFLIFVKLPAGDPARRAVGRRTDPQQIANAREAFGLDQPLIVQYGRFAKGLIPLPNTFLSEGRRCFGSSSGSRSGSPRASDRDR